jgi:flagellar basal-body rod protein FlgF
MMQTGVNLDAYINDKGLLAVQGNDGTEAYTRRGDLKVTENGILTTGAGDLVLGDAGPITIPPSSKIELSDDGVLSVTPMGQDATVLVPIARLKLVNGDKVGLKIRPDGLYETPDAQTLPVDASVRISVGALEGSSVSPVESMVQMIKDAREYEMHVRVIRNAKEMSTSSTSMVRLDS